MIKVQILSYLSLSGNKIKITEYETTVEDACRILHSLSWRERAGRKIICESPEDKKQLARTYYDIYRDEFNIRHQVNDEEQLNIQLADPSITDVFYVENLFFRFEAGIGELDPRYARVNTHFTCFDFKMAPIYECITIDNEPDEQIRTQMYYLKQNIVYKFEQLNHLCYEDARKYIEQAWSAYQELFTDSLEYPDLDKIIAINENYDIPWYKRLRS